MRTKTKYKHAFLFLAVLLTIGGQVIAYPMTCSMPNMVMPMGGTMDGMEITGHTGMIMNSNAMEVAGINAEPPSPPMSNCEQICGYCLSYNSLVQDAIEMPQIVDPFLQFDYAPPFIFSSSLDNPFRPPKAA